MRGGKLDPVGFNLPPLFMDYRLFYGSCLLHSGGSLNNL